MRDLKENEKKFLVALSRSPLLRPKLKKIISAFNDLDYFWNFSKITDFRKAELNENDFREFLNLKKDISPDDEIEKLYKENIKVIFLNDSGYPELLKEISDPPLILFVRGDLENEKNTLAIVGTRRATNYGSEIALNLSEKLAEIGITIISGLALGIDTLAHKGALNARGKTIAVLGSGINNSSIYPSLNLGLAKKILENNGAIISEYPPSYPIFKTNFPERNRLISGLSQGVIIIEAPIKSGALITANFALEQNREVFAVPGNINRKESQGTNNLIKQGAKVVTSYIDVLEEFGIDIPQEENIVPDSDEEAKIIEVLKIGPLHIDIIAQRAGLTISETSATLSLMEIKGKVQNLGFSNFSVKK